MGTFSADAGGGLRFVIDDAAYDGYVLRLGYHVEGDVVDVFMFASPPNEANAIALPLLGPASGSRQTVDVRLETNSPTVQIIFPRLVRTFKHPVEATLMRSTGGVFQGTTAVQPDGSIHPQATKAASLYRIVLQGAGNFVITEWTNGFVLADADALLNGGAALVPFRHSAVEGLVVSTVGAHHDRPRESRDNRTLVCIRRIAKTDCDEWV